MAPTLKTKYKEAVVPSLMESQGYSSKMQVPAVKKIVLNLCVSVANDRDTLTALAEDLGKITGQKAVITKAKKSVSNFKLREGMSIGARVTLRNDRMYEFMDRLVNVTLPRIRDFRGIPGTSFDGQGNYSMGLQEQTVFPEIDPDKVKKTHGMDITFVTSATKDDEAKELLTLMGMPFATGN
ncbi:50S ribosomal protein L5 [Pontiella sulfatireligans]|uniref:Large ribosomal subunit protein uL5 n=1 Tax=Pontiella sulfatireligans TaxID=2750658 RepID=A0A6C2UKP1_9BACT|nr:50S ribosomal protein L5 [Pontiella sulfatireligans]VGO20539.1 50S ribosomal protein L5 [Pontiella sulfatireligans]